MYIYTRYSNFDSSTYTTRTCILCPFQETIDAVVRGVFTLCWYGITVESYCFGINLRVRARKDSTKKQGIVTWIKIWMDVDTLTPENKAVPLADDSDTCISLEYGCKMRNVRKCRILMICGIHIFSQCYLSSLFQALLLISKIHVLWYISPKFMFFGLFDWSRIFPFCPRTGVIVTWMKIAINWITFTWICRQCADRM